MTTEIHYGHILAYVASTPWAVTADKLAEILSVLAYRATGQTFTPAQIQARLADPMPGRATATPTRGTDIIPIHGTIAHRMGSMDDSSGGTSCERIAGRFRRALADDSIGTILFDINSAGGTVVGVPELADEIFAARPTKRIVAVANGLCASAAYWLAAQAHEVISIPTGTTGSIGVLAAHTSLEKALEKEGVEITLLHYGKFKTENNPFQALTEAGRAHIQKQVDAAGVKFVAAVARGRKITPAEVRARFGDGRCFTDGQDALDAGLVDRVETVDRTLARVEAAPDVRTTGRARQTVAAHSPRDAAWQRRMDLELALLDLSLPAARSGRRPAPASLAALQLDFLKQQVEAL